MGSRKAQSGLRTSAFELSRRSFLKQSSALALATSVGRRIDMPCGIAGDSTSPAMVFQKGVGSRKIVFPRGAVIRTLLRDVSPTALASGAVLFHEHLSIHYPLTNALAVKQGAPPPTHFSDDVDLMIEETRAAGKD